MEDSDEKTFDRLSDALQVAAINLMNHLRTDHARIRIRGTTPEIYITLGEGRHSNSSDAIVHLAQENTSVAPAPDASLPALLARLRKVLAA